MIVKLKYVGDGANDRYPELVLNKVYTAVSIGAFSVNEPMAVIIDEDGRLKGVIGLPNPDYWELVSVETIGSVQIYP